MSGSKLNFVPSIKGLDQLLDLLTDKKKYFEYLKELTEMVETIRGMLGDLDTKKKVEQALTKALEMEEKAQVVLEAAEAEAKAKTEEVSDMLAKALDHKNEVVHRENLLAKEKSEHGEAYSRQEAAQKAWEKEKEKVQTEQRAEAERLEALGASLTEREAELAEKVAAVYAAVK